MATEAQILANRPNAQESTGHRSLSMSLASPADYFMQNKANLRKAKMSANVFVTKDYENKTTLRLPKNKPNQSQFQKPISAPKEWQESKGLSNYSVKMYTLFVLSLLIMPFAPHGPYRET